MAASSEFRACRPLAMNPKVLNGSHIFATDNFVRDSVESEIAEELQTAWRIKGTIMNIDTSFIIQILSAPISVKLLKLSIILFVWWLDGVPF